MQMARRRAATGFNAAMAFVQRFMHAGLSDWVAVGGSKVNVVPSLQSQDLPRLLRCRYLRAEPFNERSRALDLVGIGFGEPPWAVPQRIFEADAHVATHGQRLRGDWHLVAAHAENRPDVVVAEQAI